MLQDIGALAELTCSQGRSIPHQTTSNAWPGKSAVAPALWSLYWNSPAGQIRHAKSQSTKNMKKWDVVSNLWFWLLNLQMPVLPAVETTHTIEAKLSLVSPLLWEDLAQTSCAPKSFQPPFNIASSESPNITVTVLICFLNLTSSHISLPFCARHWVMNFQPCPTKPQSSPGWQNF